MLRASAKSSKVGRYHFRNEEAGEATPAYQTDPLFIKNG